jgi:hypothetical protein
MVRRLLLLSAVIVATAVAGCRAQPTGPAAASTLSRDLDEPACVDTVYKEGTEERPASTSPTNVASTDGNQLPGDCHVVVIWY